MRRWVWPFALLLLLALGVYWWGLRPRSKAPEGQEAPQVYTVSRGGIRVTVAASGRISPRETWEARPQVQGILLEVAGEGEVVEAGGVVAHLDPAPFRQALDRARADLERVQASLATARATGKSALASLRASVQSAESGYQAAQDTLAQAERNLEATRLLYQAGGVSRQALLDAETALAQAQRNLETARANLEAQRRALALREEQYRADLRALEAQLRQAQLAYEEAQANLAKTEVRAPWRGVVLSVAAQPGGQVGPATPLLTLARLEVEAVLEVDETEIAKVQPGLRVLLRLEALPGEEVLGQVQSLSPTAQVVNNIPVYTVTVSLPQDPRLRPGMTADGEIVVEEVQGVLVLPKRAVERVRGRAYVTRLNPDGSTEVVRVALGPEDATRVAVLEGLEEGDRVVLPTPAPARSTGGGQGPSSPPTPLPLPLGR